jgi:hypothetical protein
MTKTSVWGLLLIQKGVCLPVGATALGEPWPPLQPVSTTLYAYQLALQPWVSLGPLYNQSPLLSMPANRRYSPGWALASPTTSLHCSLCQSVGATALAEPWPPLQPVSTALYACQSALQPWVSLGLLYNQSPLLSMPANRRYSPGWALASSTTSLHCFLCLPVGATALGEPWPPLQPVSTAFYACQWALQPWVNLGLLYNQSPLLDFWTKLFFTGWGCNPHAQPSSWRTWVSLLVWTLPFDLTGMGGPAGS